MNTVRIKNDSILINCAFVESVIPRKIGETYTYFILWIGFSSGNNQHVRYEVDEIELMKKDFDKIEAGINSNN